MYYPYFRGKQYELITIRENVKTFSSLNFVPIIEPVKKSLNDLKKTLDVLEEEKVNSIVIVNPHCGDYSSNSDNLKLFFKNDLQNHTHVYLGIILSNETKVGEILKICSENQIHPIAFIHRGFNDVRGLIEIFGNKINEIYHIFLEEHCGRLYRKNFQESKNKILLRDGFQRKINRDYPELEFFSDLHVTYEDEKINGFGDFLIVGDDYSDSGGPAYAVAIHLTFIDKEQYGGMYVYHFVSDTQHTPKNPAGKFAEALNKLVHKVNEENSKIYKSTAISEFLKLYKQQHFPGLAYVKKLSMKHHIETLAEVLKA